ncbi:MAG: TauD/TfdA family dioxygenase [Acidobacteriota bacterium]
MTSFQAITSSVPQVAALQALHLPDWNRQEWTQRASRLHYPDYHDLAAWMEFREASVALAHQFLPLTIRQKLAEFFAVDGPPAIVLENLPLDTELPNIPADGLRPAGKQSVSEAAITGIVCQWGEVLSFQNEKGGTPIHEVTPVPGAETLQSNGGRVQFGFHSDNAFLPVWFRQRGILLYGLCNQGTATTVVTAEQLLDAAMPDLAESLAKHIYRHACPASFALPGGAATRESGTTLSAPCPILWRDERGIARVNAASSSIEPMNQEATHALRRFRALLEWLEPARVVVAPGTALLFKDDRVLHGRDAVSGPRWLQRAYFTDSLELMREVTGSDGRAFSFDARSLLSPRHRL